MPLSPQDILQFLDRNARHPLTLDEILHDVSPTRAERKGVERLLGELVAQGALVQLKGERYSLPRQVNLVVGTVSRHREGYGFVAPASQSGPDVFVPARFLQEVMHGDKVVVRVERGGRDGKPEGRVLRVLERAHQTLVGRFESGRHYAYVVPADPRLGQDIVIAPRHTAGARPGQMVVARIESYPARNRNPEGVVEQVLGDPRDPEVELLTIVHKLGLPYQFSPEVLAASAEVPASVPPAAHKGRTDLRELPTVTIDGETAKDFDDAVAVRREADGCIRLWVSIADVGHYVPEGGVIDGEAYERGTSVYFPGRCIPMLPEVLSNGICSLNPEVDRLCLSAEMLFGRGGERRESRFYLSVIRSSARLTYTKVRDILEQPASPERIRYAPLVPMLEAMQELAHRLTAMRRQRGSLDFDLPEAEILLDLQGRPEEIVRAERNQAHRLIEEFMLAANEAVANFLHEKGAPILYRVHEPPGPEKLQAFQEFIGHFNYGLSLAEGGVDPRELQRLLAQVAGKPEERMINQILLRSMKQARYAPENIGHFGLAAKFYCHFTSPIRRYPDLQVHRVLREVLRKGALSERSKARLLKTLTQMGEETSARERRAMEAEREMVSLKKCQFMAERVEEEFAGFVSGVTPFGFFVELAEIFVEGLVHISSLKDDFYLFEEDFHRLLGQHRRRVFQVGDEVRVRVAKVDLERREIDFVLAETPPPQPKVREPVRRPGRKPRRR
jgi:ribonuclease R